MLVYYILLVHSEEDIYNREMKVVYDDFEIMFENSVELKDSSQINAEYAKEIISECDNNTPLIENATFTLIELNNSVKNTTRKEYINSIYDACISYNNSNNYLREMYIHINDYEEKNEGISSSYHSVNDLYNKSLDEYKHFNETRDKIQNMESEYPFLGSYNNESVLIGDIITF
ncbi:MAG: hypothetical protein BZ136_08805 [Methanosphaera sp. rholeuAM74]|nr:MAG: hypothetical protein BZ136_08805 [Methanosphaera sp. rholeuAM74]